MGGTVREGVDLDDLTEREEDERAGMEGVRHGTGSGPEQAMAAS